MRVREANTRILRAMSRPNIYAMSIKLRLPMPRSNASPKPRRIELCAGRGRKENAYAFLARGRGRRQAAEAGAYLRSKYADSPRKAPALYRCDADGMTTGNTPRQRHPRTAENRTLRRACFYLRKLRPGIAPQNGTYFPTAAPPLNSKTNALSIPKLGRRRPKRNSRRST